MPRVPRKPRLLRPAAGLSLFLLVASLAVAGCTSATANAVATPIPGWPMVGQVSTNGPVPVIGSSQLAVGPNRFLFTLVNASNTPIASPDLHATVSFYDLDRDPAKAVATADARFLWAIPNERGFYVAPVTFDAAGNWGAAVATSGTGTPAQTRIRFDVLAHSTTIAVGDRAPADPTPTLASVGGDVHAISSDPNPDPDFYRVSASDALAQHKPFVIAFATPAFCQSRVCGPTLDVVKGVAKTESGFTFINVEPYELTYSGGHLQPVLDAQGNLTPTKVTNDWKLEQEPWIFVVDRDGIVRASFEGVVGADELQAAVDAVK